MKKIRNKRELQMMRHKLKYEEKILQKDVSSVSADLISDLNWNVRGLTFDLGAKLAMLVIQSLRKSKKSKKEE